MLNSQIPRISCTLSACMMSGWYGVAFAHHSFALFDPVGEIVLTGTVGQFQWTNPHTWIEMDVADDNGEVTHWSIEGGSVLGLSREGWKRDTVPWEGDSMGFWDGDTLMVNTTNLRAVDNGYQRSEPPRSEWVRQTLMTAGQTTEL